jgi:repressor LexA
MMSELTPRETDALKAIINHKNQYGYPPTIKELGNILGLKSTSTSARYVSALQRKGYIDFESGRPRTIRVLVHA